MSTAAGPYDVAIKLSVIDGLGPVLAILATQAKALQSHFDKLTASQKGLATAFGAGLE